MGMINTMIRHGKEKLIQRDMRDIGKIFTKLIAHLQNIERDNKLNLTDLRDKEIEEFERDYKHEIIILEKESGDLEDYTRKIMKPLTNTLNEIEKANDKEDIRKNIEIFNLLDTMKKDCRHEKVFFERLKRSANAIRKRLVNGEEGGEISLSKKGYKQFEIFETQSEQLQQKYNELSNLVEQILKDNNYQDVETMKTHITRGRAILEGIRIQEEALHTIFKNLMLVLSEIHAHFKKLVA